MGLRVEALHRGAQRRAFTHIDDAGERTITVLGERLTPLAADPLPWPELAESTPSTSPPATTAPCSSPAAPASSSPPRASRRSCAPRRRRPRRPRRQRPRPRRTIRRRRYRAPAAPRRPHRRRPRRHPPEPDGGELRTYPPTPLPGPVVDAYGCGDAFAAGLTFALGAGQSAAAAAVHSRPAAGPRRSRVAARTADSCGRPNCHDKRSPTVRRNCGRPGCRVIIDSRSDGDHSAPRTHTSSAVAEAGEHADPRHRHVGRDDRLGGRRPDADEDPLRADEPQRAEHGEEVVGRRPSTRASPVRSRITARARDPRRGRERRVQQPGRARRSRRRAPGSSARRPTPTAPAATAARSPPAARR
jgi:hypothetical protein